MISEEANFYNRIIKLYFLSNSAFNCNSIRFHVMLKNIFNLFNRNIIYALLQNREFNYAKMMAFYYKKRNTKKKKTQK